MSAEPAHFLVSKMLQEQRDEKNALAWRGKGVVHTPQPRVSLQRKGQLTEYLEPKE